MSTNLSGNSSTSKGGGVYSFTTGLGRTDFEENDTSVSKLSIYMSLAALVLFLVSLTFIVLYCRLRKDMKNKTRRLVAETDNVVSGDFGKLSESAL